MKKKKNKAMCESPGARVSLFFPFSPPTPTHYDGEFRKRLGRVSSILKHGKARKNGSRIIANHYRFSSWFPLCFRFESPKRTEVKVERLAQEY